jgi:hypothetical protein
MSQNAFDGTYLIRKYDGTFAQATPTQGKWYCGFTFDDGYFERGCGYAGPDKPHGYRDETIAEYLDGEFYPEAVYDDQPDAVEMGVYDFIAEQSP